MSRRSLQFDNKKTSKKSGSFFDVAFDTETEAEVENTPVFAKADNVTTEGVACEKNDKRFRTVAIIVVGVLIAMLIASLAIFGGKLFGGDIDASDGKNPAPTVYEIYKPDWETDIFELEEYRQLSPGDITYSKDGVSFTYKDGDGIENNKALVFFKKYFDAVKKADIDTLNLLFTEEYISENGSFGSFPMQKIYNIEIIEQSTTDALDKEYQNQSYGLYMVKYNIYHNDGLFCAEVDERYARVEGIVVIFDGSGNGKISRLIDAKDYYNE